MKIFFYILSILLTVGGVIWFLQGINFLPGSFMTGQVRWAYYGVMAVIAGIAMYIHARNMKATPPNE
ncbi:MAG: hypothetical protein ABIJ65_13105 [Chloroflexota bacterium]